MIEESSSLKDFSELPSMVRHMLCQTWIFQSIHRNQYGIYDTYNPDSYPESLVEMSNDDYQTRMQEANTSTEKSSIWD